MVSKVRVRDRHRVRRPGQSNAVAALVVAGLSVLVLAGCHSASHTARRAAPPQQVLATPAAGGSAPSGGGSPGVGPIVVPNGQQNVALGDRTLTVNRAVRAAGSASSSVSVRVDVAIQNSAAVAITNDSTTFQVMGPDGDIFPAKPDASTSATGTIAAHSVRTGTVAFDVPAAATTGLRLMYRPSAGGQTVFIPLNLG